MTRKYWFVGEHKLNGVWEVFSLYSPHVYEEDKEHRNAIGPFLRRKAARHFLEEIMKMLGRKTKRPAK